MEFENEICDPDVEARLYAEIYYSNESYAQNFETEFAKQHREQQRKKNETTAPKEFSMAPMSLATTLLTGRPKRRGKALALQRRREHQWEQRKQRDRLLLTSSVREIDNRGPCDRARNDAPLRVIDVPNSTNEVFETSSQEIETLGQEIETSSQEIEMLSHEIESRYEIEGSKDANVAKADDVTLNENATSTDSDSDASILEVAAPPRARPPLIELSDSDEDRRSRRDDREIGTARTETTSEMEATNGFIDTVERNVADTSVTCMEDAGEIPAAVTEVERERVATHIIFDVSNVEGSCMEDTREIPAVVTEVERERDAADIILGVSNVERSTIDRHFFLPMSKELQSFYNDPWAGGDLDLQDAQRKMPHDPRHWAILDADLRPPAKGRGKSCPICKGNWHYGRRCPERARVPSCSMCGAKGHAGTRCPQTMCLTCGQKYSSFRPICSLCRKLCCEMCGGTGHVRNNCPDLWRRYHDITTEETPIPPRSSGSAMKPPRNLSCCNCARRGHDATFCGQLRWSQHFPTPLRVSSYTDGPGYGVIPSREEEEEKVEEDNSIVQSILDTGESGNVSDQNAKMADVVLFECGNRDVVSYSHEMSDRLDTMVNVDLKGLLSGASVPVFLHNWLAYFAFRVRIARGSDSSTKKRRNPVTATIAANSEELLFGISKILLQWLSRDCAERTILVYDALHYNSIDAMRNVLAKRSKLLHNVRHPIEMLRRLKVVEENRNALIRNGGKKMRLKVPGMTRKVIRSRGYLITSLYAGSWVEGGNNLLSFFAKIVDRVNDTAATCLALGDFMELVFLYNEIFVFHHSEILERALARAVTKNMLSSFEWSLSRVFSSCTDTDTTQLRKLRQRAGKVGRASSSNSISSRSSKFPLRRIQGQARPGRTKTKVQVL